MLRTMTLPGKVLLFAAVTAVCSVERVLASCDSGWTQFQDKCYIKKATNGTFFETDKWCHSMGATMVSIHSLPQNEFVRTFIPGTYTWLGGHQIHRGLVGNKWLDGSQWDFSNVLAGYTNPSSTPSSCWDIRTAGDWGWNSCSNQYFQMCQKHVEEVETKHKCREMTAQTKEIQTAVDNLRLEMNKNLRTQSIDIRETRRELAESLHQLNAAADANRESIERFNSSFLAVNEKAGNQCPIGWQRFCDFCYQ